MVLKDNKDGVVKVIADDEGIRVKFLSLSNVFKSNDDEVCLDDVTMFASTPT